MYCGHKGELEVVVDGSSLQPTITCVDHFSFITRAIDETPTFLRVRRISEVDVAAKTLQADQ
jgi:hypothetical protein